MMNCILRLFVFFALALFVAAEAPCSAPFTTATTTWIVRATDRAETGEKWLLVNDKWPAKPIIKQRCTKLELTVVNKLPSDDVTLHFHGLLQNEGQTMMDGVQGLSQSGISTNQSFTYHVDLNKEGTYWIHSHSAGQYPQGLRAPLIVRPLGSDITGDNYQPKIFDDPIVTLSDWWPDFKDAEERSRTDECLGGGNKGVEVPPKRVTFNDVWGYNRSTTPVERNAAEEARTVSITCGETKRIRLINMSSHSRFYVAFNDARNFDVIELDGIIYDKKSTSMLELASGQRASILVNGRSSTKANACKSAFIVALSDPKIGAGTENCPLEYTRTGYSLQYTHGYLQVTEGNNKDPLPSVSADSPIGEPKLEPGTHFPPEWATKLAGDRLNLDYKKLHYEEYGHEELNFGISEGSFRNKISYLGVGGNEGAEELNMQPAETIPAWIVDKADMNRHMHYISLKDVSGLAAMTENWQEKTNDFALWESPDKYTTAQNIKWPTLYRVLEDGKEDRDINAWTTYVDGPAQRGRTVVLTDDQPHWFIFRSWTGDHPIHMHGHHFQVLAKLPPAWFKQTSSKLYDLVTKDESVAVEKQTRAYMKNPARRDTLMIEKGFTYVISIKADNPGVWALHCHNDIHAVSGMFSQIIERPADLRKKLGSWAVLPQEVNGKKEMRWWYSDYTEGTWRSKSDIANWMVQSFNVALTKYGMSSTYFANNPNLPSKWGYSGSMKRWLPRGTPWY